MLCQWPLLYFLPVKCFSKQQAYSLLGLFFSYDIFRVDTRSNNTTGEAILIHKKGSKVVGLHCNPVQPDLLLSCGNDHFVSF
jgi:DNA damage-binding protein 2